MKKYLIATIVIIALALIAWRSGKIKEIINPLVSPSATSTTTVTPGDTGNQPVACTMEAKQCPDGSYVGRTGPKCEFAACPSANKTVIKMPEFGVQMTVPAGLDDLQYAILERSKNIMGFSTVALSKTGLIDCSVQWSPLGSLTRSNDYPVTGFGERLSPDTVKQIGDYYYYYTHPQASCSALSVAPTRMLNDSWKSLEPIK